MIFSVSTVSFAMSMDMSLNPTKDIKANDTVIYTLSLSEKIIGASFKINYDRDQLELVESGTTNLSASVNHGKIACVYFDMEKTGIDSCSIKFKAKKNIENTKLIFELEEAKFIAKNGERSYSQNDIAGIKKTITIGKSDDSNSGNNGSTNKNPSNSDNNNNDVNDDSNNSSNNNNTNDDLNNSNDTNGNTNNSNNSNNTSGNTNNSNNSNNTSGNTNNSNNSTNTSGNTDNSNNSTNTNGNTNNSNNANGDTNNTNSSKSDYTMASTKLPKTGLHDSILLPIGLISMFAIYFFVKMKARKE